MTPNLSVTCWTSNSKPAPASTEIAATKVTKACCRFMYPVCTTRRRACGDRTRLLLLAGKAVCVKPLEWRPHLSLQKPLSLRNSSDGHAV